MTERKFTDEEVIKALECCINEDCENCPAHMCCDDDTEKLVKYVFDLINRQKKEIERLHELLDSAVSNERNLADTLQELTEVKCE